MKIGENSRIRDDILELMAAFGLRAPQMVVIYLKARATAAGFWSHILNSEL